MSELERITCQACGADTEIPPEAWREETIRRACASCRAPIVYFTLREAPR